MTDTLSLAERIERAEGPDRETFLEAGRAVMEEWGLDRRALFADFVQSGAWLDAAMALVPDGWGWMAGHREFPHARAYVENRELAFVGLGGARRNPARKWFEVTAATPALALAAAALKARADMEKE